MGYVFAVIFSGYSEGRRQLLDLLQRTKGIDVAEQCDVWPSTVSQWARGDRVPEYTGRRSLSENFAIPMDAWDREAVFKQAPRAA